MQKNVVLSLVAVVALAVAGYLIFSSTTSDALPSEYSAQAWSFASNQEVTVEYAAGDAEPFICPVSGSQTAYRLHYCNNCDHKVVPQLTNDNGKFRIIGYSTCPNCGSTALTAYDPETMPEAANAELALPKEHP